MAGHGHGPLVMLGAWPTGKFFELQLFNQKLSLLKGYFYND